MKSKSKRRATVGVAAIRDNEGFPCFGSFHPFRDTASVPKCVKNSQALLMRYSGPVHRLIAGSCVHSFDAAKLPAWRKPARDRLSLGGET